MGSCRDRAAPTKDTRDRSGFALERAACPATARLEDDDRRLMGTPCSVAVQVLVQFAPTLPKPFTLAAHGGPAEHVAPNHTSHLDDRLRAGLQVQPPGWLGRTPAVHGHRDQVVPVLVVADGSRSAACRCACLSW